jgi:sugar/nucleoside kinase (ribokinase family)
MKVRFPSPRDIFIGELRHEFLLSIDDKTVQDTPGGNVLYAAAGFKIWEKDQVPGICARVGEDYHQNLLEEFRDWGINTEGIVILPRDLDLRVCYIQSGNQAKDVKDAVPYFSQVGLAVPPALIGYSRGPSRSVSRTSISEFSIRQNEIPSSYISATGAHICPLDYLTHNLLPAVLRQQGFSSITLDPCSSYMDSGFLSDVPALMPGLTAFLPSESDLRNLYKGITTDIWEMATELGRFGCELLIVRRGLEGQYLYVPATGKKWFVPAYPARIKNHVGIGDAFCGGFFAGYRRSFDPLQAVMYGSVAASLVIEGSEPGFALKTLPGLAEARLEKLRDMVVPV